MTQSSHGGTRDQSYRKQRQNEKKGIVESSFPECGDKIVNASTLAVVVVASTFENPRTLGGRELVEQEACTRWCDTRGDTRGRPFGYRFQHSYPSYPERVRGEEAEE